MASAGHYMYGTEKRRVTMKKLLAFIMTIVMVFVLCSCDEQQIMDGDTGKTPAGSGSDQQTGNEAAGENAGIDGDDIGEEDITDLRPEEIAAGGWQVRPVFKDTYATEDAASLFEKADTGELQLIAYLGEKDDGSACAYLCRQEAQLSLVRIDREGSKVHTVPVFLGQYAGADVESNAGILVGGWDYVKATRECELPERVREAYNRAFEGFAGMPYVPMAFLGSQVVAGANYAVLCSGTTLSAKAFNVYVVTVYAAPDDTAEVLSVKTIDLESIEW